MTSVTLLIHRMKAARARYANRDVATVVMSADVLERLRVEIWPLLRYEIVHPSHRTARVMQIDGLNVELASGFAILKVK